VYSESTKVLSILLMVLGVAMVATTIARGGGVLAVGVVLGVLFVVLGGARLRLARVVRR
jgi:hypothetical protein